MKAEATYRIARSVIATVRALPGPGRWGDDTIIRELADPSRFCTVLIDSTGDRRTLDVAFGNVASDGTRQQIGAIVGLWDGDSERLATVQAAFRGEPESLPAAAEALDDYLRLPVSAGVETTEYEAMQRKIREWCPAVAS